MIWHDCHGEAKIKPLSGTLFRLVQRQEQSATLDLVDTLEEQALLEQMLEESKPSIAPESGELHYLLKTPFRYPPLPWGSRFGRRSESSVFYAGTGIEVTLAESAYYRFVFWTSMDAESIKPQIRTEHTLFSVGYGTEQGVQLQQTPFLPYQAELTDPKGYQHCQQLGSTMREAGIEAFEYPSARDPLKGICVGVFTPAVFTAPRPQEMNQWLCEVTATEVSFKQTGDRAVTTFPFECFAINGELPLPA